MIRIYLFILTCLLSTGAAATPMLTTDGSGNVTGATGLEADGSTYSMEFVDGTCIDIYDGCDSNDDFIVPGTGDVTHSDLLGTFYDAFIAPVLTTDDNSLDAQPSKAIGCENPELCFTFAPDRFDPVFPAIVDGIYFANVSYDDFDDRDIPPTTVEHIYDKHPDDVAFIDNWAVFTVQPTAVPSPGTLPLVALGLLVLGLRRKGKTTQ